MYTCTWCNVQLPVQFAKISCSVEIVYCAVVECIYPLAFILLLIHLVLCVWFVCCNETFSVFGLFGVMKITVIIIV